jgi:plastocyanin
MRLDRHARVAAVAFAAAVALAGCTGNSGPATPFPSLGADAVVITAKNTQFTTQSVHVPANRPWTLAFDNQDGLPHNVVITDKSNTTVFTGTIVNGPTLKVEAAPALAAGEYPFTCVVHPEMHGTLIVP